LVLPVNLGAWWAGLLLKKGTNYDKCGLEGVAAGSLGWRKKKMLL